MIVRITSLAFAVALVACTRPDASAPPVPAEQPVQTRVQPASPPVSDTASALVRVADPSTVCMVNDQFMGSPQIPVQVDGKTYYGCCEMCQARLNKDPKVRFGRDPVTQRDVDKASAVMAKNANGKVWYFENEDSLKTYSAKL